MPRAPPSLVVPIDTNAPRATQSPSNPGSPESSRAGTSTGVPAPPASNQSDTLHHLASRTLSAGRRGWCETTPDDRSCLHRATYTRCQQPAGSVAPARRRPRSPVDMNGPHAGRADADSASFPGLRQGGVARWDVGGVACEVTRRAGAADRCVVWHTPEAGPDREWSTDDPTKVLEDRQQLRAHDASTTVTTVELGPGEVGAEITHRTDGAPWR